jgi:hypothetical protein
MQLVCRCQSTPSIPPLKVLGRALTKQRTTVQEALREQVLALIPRLDVHRLLAIEADEDHPERVRVREERVLALATENLRCGERARAGMYLLDLPFRLCRDCR